MKLFSGYCSRELPPTVINKINNNTMSRKLLISNAWGKKWKSFFYHLNDIRDEPAWHSLQRKTASDCFLKIIEPRYEWKMENSSLFNI